MLIDIALNGVILPALVAALIAVAAGRPWREPSRASAAILGPAVALGFLVSYWRFFGVPSLVPIDVVDWLPHLSLLGAAACVIEAVIAARSVRWAARGVTSLVAMWLLLRPLAANDWGAAQAAAIIVGSGLALALYWHVVALGASGERPVVSALFAVIVTGGAAAAIASSGSLKIGQLGGAVAAGAGGLAAMMLVFARAAPMASAAGVIAVMTGSALVLGHAYSELPVASLALLGAVPPGYVLVKSRLRERVAVRLVLAAVMTAAAVALAAMPPTADSDAGGNAPGYGYD